jgi:hypothetical protein
MLWHTPAALAYRLSLALESAPEDFESFRAGESVRSPVEILAHMGDLMDWAQ